MVDERCEMAVAMAGVTTQKNIIFHLTFDAGILAVRKL